MAGSRTPRQGKYRNHLGQPLGLLGHGACGGGRFLHQRGVLLRHLVELPYRLVDLGNAGRLVARSRMDLAHHGTDLLHRPHDLRHGAARFVGQLPPPPTLFAPSCQ